MDRYVPFPEGRRLLKQVIRRKGDPLYSCLQFMWKDRLIKFYEKNKLAIPNPNEAHHVFPVEYGGLDAFGDSIIPSSNLPKPPIVGKAKIRECFDTINVGKYDLDNGVLLSKSNHSKFTIWWAIF